MPEAPDGWWVDHFEIVIVRKPAAPSDTSPHAGADEAALVDRARRGDDEAFAILRAASQRRTVKLREVAALLIENLTGHQAAEPPRFGRSGR